MFRSGAVSLLAAAAAAQPVVLPSSVATVRPNTLTTWTPSVFYSHPTMVRSSRAQLIYATSDIPRPVAVWVSLAVRRPFGEPNPNYACTTNATLDLSVSPLAYTSATNAFAANPGPNPTTVLAGRISLPARTDPPTWPAPWEPIPFTMPFVYQASTGQSLVVDLFQSGNTAPSSWVVELMTTNTGRRFNNGLVPDTCRLRNNGAMTSLSYDPPVIGRSWWVAYGGGPMPLGVVAVGVLGASGRGASWGGVTLPIDLTPFGAPACSWNVSVEVTAPLRYLNGTYIWPPVPIPNDPNLVERDFFDQGVIYDPLANAMGVFTTFSSRWHIGNGAVAPAAYLYAFEAAATGPTGNLTRPGGVSILLQ